MKCSNRSDTTLWCDIMVQCVNSLRRPRTVYAGLFVLFVPFVICESVDRSKYLTYDDSIFNHTKYPQLQSKRPYQPLNLTQVHLHRGNYLTKHRNKLYDDISSENELEYEELEFNKHNNKRLNSNDLLVGFSYDPYRFSVPEKDFVKGVRNYQPSDMKNENRGKRGVAHLYNMIYCATGCEPLIYKGYGCYCGFLGAGRTTDGIDRCCKMHDQCYEALYCPFFTVYFQPYYWKCYHGEPLCALENYKTRNQLINGCAGRLCECDRELAMCLRRYSCPRRRALCRSSPIRLLQNVLMLR